MDGMMSSSHETGMGGSGWRYKLAGDRAIPRLNEPRRQDAVEADADALERISPCLMTPTPQRIPTFHE
jgi:hypothetical protein